MHIEEVFIVTELPSKELQERGIFEVDSYHVGCGKFSITIHDGWNMCMLVYHKEQWATFVVRASLTRVEQGLAVLLELVIHVLECIINCVPDTDPASEL